MWNWIISSIYFYQGWCLFHAYLQFGEQGAIVILYFLWLLLLSRDD